MPVPGAPAGAKTKAAAAKKAPAKDPLEAPVVEKPAASSSGGRPDKEVHDREQKEIIAQIDVLQAKANDIRAKINGSSKSADADRRAELRSELENLRGEQAKVAGGRKQMIEQLKRMREQNQARIKDLNAARAKAPFKSIAEVDTRIQDIERKVESGTMKLVDEKRALAEVSTLRKSRKAVEAFAEKQAEIDAARAECDKLSAQLDDPEGKAKNDEFTRLKDELAKIDDANRERQGERDGLFAQRNELQVQIDELYTKKKDAIAAYRAANDRFYQKMQDDRNRRLERQRAEKAKFEEEKREVLHSEWREEASAPAFEREIEDCKTLIEYLTRLGGGGAPPAAPVLQTANGAIKGVAQHDIRTVDDAVPDGAVVMTKKKGDEEEYFVGGGKGKKKGGKKTGGGEGAAPAKFQLPFSTLSALLQLGITAPTSDADVPRTVEDLSKKRAYFEANQERVTKERMEAVEQKIRAYEGKSAAKHANGINGDATEDAPEDKAEESAAAPDAAQEAEAVEAEA